MKTRYYIIMCAIASAAVASAVFAAGGGGGGSVPTCTDNVWDCTNWSSCSTSGTQTRNCSLTFSCLSATNQKPAESQACTPPPPPTVTPPPSTLSACVHSIWQCGSWSSSCDTNGQEHRVCNLVTDCLKNPTPSSATNQPCSHLQCGNKPTLAERVSCRTGLAPAGVLRELQIQYLPEECRVVANAAEKKECIERYKNFQSCWTLPVGEGRFACARGLLHLGVSAADEVKSCQIASDKKSCMDTLKEKTLYMIKFRFYDLEQRAEDLYYKGADSSAIADFDTVVETKKQEFDQAKTKEQLRQIILDVRQAWEIFKNRVKGQIK